MRVIRGTRLDRPTPGDIPAIHAIYSDPRVWKHLPSGRFSERAQTERMVGGWIEGSARDHLSSWILRDVETGEAVEAAHRLRPEIPVVAYLLEHNVASAHVATGVGLVLVHRCADTGNPDPTAIRLVFVDRELDEAELATVLEH